MKKKLIFGGILVAIIAIVIGINVFGKAPTIPVVETAKLEKMDLINTVNVTGTVEASGRQEVYSPLSYTVQNVFVEVGDHVEAGDILCKLDTSSVAAQIKISQAQIASQKQSAEFQVEMSEKKYTNAQELKEQDFDTQIISAESEIASATIALKDAKENYSDASTNYYDAKHTDDGYINYFSQVSDGLSESTPELSRLRTLMEQAERAVEAAEVRLDTAKRNHDAILYSTGKNLEDYKDNIRSAELGTNFEAQYLEIQKLQQDIAKSTITAPISGIVTEVHAVKNASGAGLLFVIENIDDLKITTKIKEYDINSVQIGYPVTIKSDSTGEDVYQGTVEKMSSVSAKSTGATSKTAEYETDIKVVSEETRLLAGMSTRLSIVIEEKKDVLAIPYQSLTTNQKGEDIVFVADKQEDGTYLVKEVPVKLGMESDFYAEVISTELSEGSILLSQIENITAGMQILPSSEAENAEGQDIGEADKSAEGKENNNTLSEDNKEIEKDNVAYSDTTNTSDEITKSNN